jgi:DNA-binding Lrp family transcriptional regulator
LQAIEFWVIILLGRLLAFVDIFVDSSFADEVVQTISQIPNAEAVYRVSGGRADIVSLVSASDMSELREILNKKILKIRGVKGRVSSIALTSHKSKIVAPRATQA